MRGMCARTAGKDLWFLVSGSGFGRMTAAAKESALKFRLAKWMDGEGLDPR